MTSITVTGDGYIALDAYDSGMKCELEKSLLKWCSEEVSA